MASVTFREYILASLSIAYDKLRLPENIFKSVVASMKAISAREWIKFTGQELGVLPAGITVTPMGELQLDGAAQAPVTITFPKISLSQEATLHEVLLEGAGVTVAILKEYPAVGEQPASVRTFNANQVPLITNNFTLRVTFQPGALLRHVVVLYEINV